MSVAPISINAAPITSAALQQDLANPALQQAPVDPASIDSGDWKGLQLNRSLPGAMGMADAVNTHIGNLEAESAARSKNLDFQNFLLTGIKGADQYANEVMANPDTKDLGAQFKQEAASMAPFIASLDPAKATETMAGLYKDWHGRLNEAAKTAAENERAANTIIGQNARNEADNQTKRDIADTNAVNKKINTGKAADKKIKQAQADYVSSLHGYNELLSKTATTKVPVGELAKPDTNTGLLSPFRSPTGKGIVDEVAKNPAAAKNFPQYMDPKNWQDVPDTTFEFVSGSPEEKAADAYKKKNRDAAAILGIPGLDLSKQPGASESSGELARLNEFLRKNPAAKEILSKGVGSNYLGGNPSAPANNQPLSLYPGSSAATTPSNSDMVKQTIERAKLDTTGKAKKLIEDALANPQASGLDSATAQELSAALKEAFPSSDTSIKAPNPEAQ